jgi:hypothetical protein
MKKISKSLLAILICMFISCFAFAQSPSDPGDPGGDPDEGIPIDGGVSLLVAGSIVYGVKKLKDKYQEEGKENI